MLLPKEVVSFLSFIGMLCNSTKALELRLGYNIIKTIYRLAFPKGYFVNARLATLEPKVDFIVAALQNNGVLPPREFYEAEAPPLSPMEYFI